MNDDRFSDDKERLSISEEEKEKRWDTIHLRAGNREDIRNQYDGWLECDERLSTIISETKTPILDLGCGVGIDTLHLVELGHKVIACDFSNTALIKIKENIPEAKTLQFNMKEKLPFGDEMFEFVLANKSIHYFSEKETKQLISELYRIIKQNGTFAFVVNSTNDSNFGAGQGIMLETNYYEVRGTTKRFFDENTLKRFFDEDKWEFIFMQEGEIQDERIKTVQLQVDKKEANKKITWTCLVRKK